MSVFDDEQTIQQLEAEKAAIQNGPHNGYADASRFARLESEIQDVQRRIARERQRGQDGEG